VIEPRVLRGGSWNNNPDNARAGYRNNNHPDNRNNNIGFRLVCSSHIGFWLPPCRPVPSAKAKGMRRTAMGWMARARPVRAFALWNAGRIYKPGVVWAPNPATPPTPFGTREEKN
jgi:Sulfatase-modifying factor enzyme 1